MIRGYVVCEGQTEETFINTIIKPILSPQQIFLEPVTISTGKFSIFNSTYVVLIYFKPCAKKD